MSGFISAEDNKRKSDLDLPALTFASSKIVALEHNINETEHNNNVVVVVNQDDDMVVYTARSARSKSGRRRRKNDVSKDGKLYSPRKEKKLTGERKTIFDTISDSVGLEKTELDLQVDQLAAETAKNREERVLVARKLEEYRKSSAERQKKRRDVENDISLLKKRKIYESLIQQKVIQLELEQKMSEINTNERALLYRLDNLDFIKKSKAEEFREDISAYKDVLQAQLGTVLEKMEVELDGEIINVGLKKARDEIEANVEVVNELMNVLQENYDTQMENIKIQRQDFEQERHFLDQALKKVTCDATNDFLYDEDKFNQSYLQALQMELAFKVSLDELENRVRIVENETEWLYTLPNNSEWVSMLNRIKITKGTKNIIEKDNERVKLFFESQLKKQDITREERELGTIDNAAKEFFAHILDEFNVMACKNVANEMIVVATTMHNYIDNVVMKAICFDDVSNFSKDIIDLNGLNSVYIGCVKDVRRTNYSVTAKVEDDYTGYKVKRTQQVVFNTSKIFVNSENIVEAKPRSEWSAHTNLTLSIRESMRAYTSDRQKSKCIEDFETRHWNMVNIKAIPQSPINIYDSGNRPTTVRLFPKFHSQSSVLVTGTKNGNVFVYKISWDGQPPLLIGEGPALPRNERAPVVDIKESTTGLHEIIVLTKIGHVYVYLYSQNLKKKRHKSFIFPERYTDFVSIKMSCSFHVSPFDLNLPTKGGDRKGNIIRASKKEQKNSMIPFFSSANPQEGTKILSVAFHPSSTYSGRNTSILVGTAGGDIMKFNMDQKNDEVDCSVVHIPPFVEREYVHPVNSTKGIVLLSGKVNRSGNKVFREIFHFHKAKVIFLEVVMRITRSIISIDDKYNLAVWKYHDDFFEGKAWFRPEKATKLDLLMSGFVEDTYFDCDEPISFLTNPLSKKPLLQEIAKTNKGNRVEIYHPYPLDGELIQYKVVRKVKIKKDGILSSISQWQKRKLKEYVMIPIVEMIISSPDGSRLYFLLLFTNPAKKIIASIQSIALDTLKFEQPQIQFLLESDDQILGMNTGPILAETYTRFMFVQSKKSGLRIFSLETGEEIFTPNFPFLKLEAAMKNFNPLVCSICPSQRVLVLGNVDDARIPVYLLTHEQDGIPKTGRITIPPDLKAFALRHPTEYIENFIVSVIQDSTSIDDAEGLEHATIAMSIINDLFTDLIYPTIDSNETRRLLNMQKQNMQSLYGENNSLGFVRPVEWPVEYENLYDAVYNDNDEEIELGLRAKGAKESVESVESVEKTKISLSVPLPQYSKKPSFFARVFATRAFF